MVVAVAVAGGDAPAQLDDSVDSLGAADVGPLVREATQYVYLHCRGARPSQAISPIRQEAKVTTILSASFFPAARSPVA